jgi:hypothetical protein
MKAPESKKEGIMSTLEEALKHLNADPQQLVDLIAQDKKPAATRAKILQTALHAIPPPQQEVLLASLLQKFAADSATGELAQLKELYQQKLLELEQGPVRPATFIDLISEGFPGPKPKARVISPDGQERYAMLHPEIRAEGLIRGMTMLLDPKCAMALGCERGLPCVGQEATLLRTLDEVLVEVSLRDERFIVYASQEVLDAVAGGNLKNG